MKVIAFTGMPFSGKSEAVEIAKNLEITVVRMGEMVWEEVKKQALDLTSENVGRVAHEMRLTGGMDIWAQKTIQKIKEMNVSFTIVVDGIRNSEEINAFKQFFGPDFFLISIDASDNIRHQRAFSRKRIDDSANIEDIIKRDEREIKWGVKKVMEKADKKVKNEESLQSFQKKIKHFFHSI